MCVIFIILPIDILDSHDGQSISSSLRIEPFAVLFWALGIVLAHILKQLLTQPVGLASLHCGTGTVLYSVRQGSVRINLREDASAPSLYPSCCVIYLWFCPSLLPGAKTWLPGAPQMSWLRNTIDKVIWRNTNYSVLKKLKVKEIYVFYLACRTRQ